MKIKKLLLMSTLISAPVIINNLIFKKTNKNIDKSDKNYYNWRFGKIRYIVKGRGEPLLLIHDTVAGSGLHEWTNIIENLSKYHKVYAIDLLGYGFSDKPGITYSSYLYVSLINDFISEVIKAKTSIVVNGNSSGFAVLANIFKPDLVNKFILISPHGIKDQLPDKKDYFKKFILEAPIIGTSIYTFLTSKLFYKMYFKRYINKIDKKMLNDYYKSAHLEGVNSKYSNAAFLSNYLNINLNNHLSRIEVPVHIIWGKEDEVNPISQFNRIIETCPNLSLTVFNTKSLPHVEEPESFYKTCKMFLAG